MRIVLELLRIIIIFVFLGGFLSGMLMSIYQSIGVTSGYRMFGSLGILLLLFISYRNNWKFTGWVKGDKKLSRKISNYLIITSVLLISLPLIIYFL